MSNASKIKKPSKASPKLKVEPEPLKLDFGAGQSPVPGYKSVDLYAPNVDFKVDLFQVPFRNANGTATIKFKGMNITAPCQGPALWKDGSVDEIVANHFVEHIPQDKRWPFFEECWRILKEDGQMKITVPNWKSERAYGDCTHCWPPFTAFSLYYLHKGWREANKLTHGSYAIKCNFEHQAGANGVSQEFQQRNHEVQMFALQHYHESYQDMWCVLTKKPM